MSTSLTIYPGQSLQGTVSLPGDKSLSHRAALFAGLAHGVSRVDNFLNAGVTQAMLVALAALGIHWEMDGTRLTVYGSGLEGLRSPDGILDCGSSATTLRLLAGALAAGGVPATLDGSPGLRHRPMSRIIEPLRQMGVVIQGQDGCAPLVLGCSERPLRGLNYALAVSSAQVKSCLLLAALAADSPTTLSEPGPSRDHTERMLRSMGVSIDSIQPAADAIAPQFLSSQTGSEVHPAAYVTRLIPSHPLNLAPLNLTLPGDISSAAFLIVAALISPGSYIYLQNIGLNPTRIGLIEALAEMGADLQMVNLCLQGGEPAGDLVVRASTLHGTRVSGSLVVRMIDEFPAFAVAAAFAQGRTVVSQAEELRHKESDRITALCTELRRLGVQVEEAVDGFTIIGRECPQGGEVASHGDHRLAMALALVGLAARQPVTVHGAEVIGESFPEFGPILAALGARLEPAVFLTHQEASKLP